jgi:hypothetical protein
MPILFLVGCSAFKLQPRDTGYSPGARDTAGAPGDDGGAELDPDDPFCDESFSTAKPGGPDCVTDTIACGDTIHATTEGGSTAFVGDDYTHMFCFVNIYNRTYEGAERVYALDLDADVYATVTVSSPCSDMDLAVIKWADEDACPVYGNAPSNCEGDDEEGDDYAEVSWDAPSRWLVVVEPKLEGTAGNFELSVTCE